MASIQDILGGDPNGILAAMNPWSKDVLVGQMQGGAQRNAMAGQALQGQMIAAQQQEMQRQAQQQQMGDQALTSYLANPTSDGLTRVSAYAPQIFKQIKDAHDLKNEDQQRQDLRGLSSLDGMLSAGDWEGAAAAQQRRLDADRKAGLDVSEDQHGLDLIQQKSPAALAFTRAKLYAVLGPEKYAAAVKDQGDSDRANAELPGKIALTKAQAASANAEVPLKAAQTADEIAKAKSEGVKVVGSDQSLVQVGGDGAGPAAGDQPSSLKAYAQAVIPTERSNRPGVTKNPLSSADGDGQFLKGTWLQMVKTHRPDLANGKSEEQILALRADSNLSAEMVGAYAQDNAPILQQAGMPINTSTLAMAHKLGPDNAVKVFKANQNTPMAAVLSPKERAANPNIAKQTVGQYATGLVQKLGTAPVDVSQGTSAPATGGGARVLFQGSNVQATQAVNAAANSGLTGDDFLAQLPAGQQTMVKALAEGRKDFPNGNAMKSQYWQNMLAAVGQYDPKFDQANFGARSATRKSFTSGPDAKNIKSLNTALGHADELDKAIDGLENTSIPANNWAAHGIAKATGTDKRLARFDSAKIALAGELTNVFRGSPGTEIDVQGWLKQFEDAKNPVTLHESLSTIMGLLRSRVNAVGESYNKGMGTTADPLTLLDPHAQAAMKRLDGKTTTFDVGNGAKAVVVERR